MIPVILVSDSEEWHAPLSALLRERRLDTTVAVDVFDVIPVLAEHPGALVVVGPEQSADDARLLLAGLRRRVDEPIVLLIGSHRDDLDSEDKAREAGFAGIIADPMRFVQLRDRLVSLAPSPPDEPGGDEAPEPRRGSPVRTRASASLTTTEVPSIENVLREASRPTGDHGATMGNQTHPHEPERKQVPEGKTGPSVADPPDRDTADFNPADGEVHPARSISPTTETDTTARLTATTTEADTTARLTATTTETDTTDGDGSTPGSAQIQSRTSAETSPVTAATTDARTSSAQTIQTGQTPQPQGRSAAFPPDEPVEPWRPMIGPSAAVSSTWLVRPLHADRDDSDEPLRREDIERLLRLARHEDYFTFLGLPRTSTAREVADRAAIMRRRLAPRALPPALQERWYAELREISAAVSEAEAVLTSERGRLLYLRGLRSAAPHG